MKSLTFVLMLVLLSIACGGSNSTPAPTPTPTPAPMLAMFTDAATGTTTTDVRDVDDQIVQFDTVSGSLIWTATGERFTGYPVAGNVIAGSFEVRFGTKDGQRRGYFTESASKTICNIEVTNGQLSITGTNATVPQS